MGLLTSATLILAAPLGGGLVYFCSKLYRARAAFYYGMVKKNLPMPKWNPVLGHLLALDEAYKKYSLPVDLHRHDMFGAMSRDFPETDGLFYADVWPFINPLLIVTSPVYAIQTYQRQDLDKPVDLVSFMHPIAGGNTIFTSNGQEWKNARSLFSSGFNSAYILNQTEYVVREAEEYVSVLEEHARSGKMFLLDDVHLKYTMNISGLLTLNMRLDAFKSTNPLVSSMRNTIEWHYIGERKSPLVRWSPLIRVLAWYNGRVMDGYIGNILDQRYQNWREGKVTSAEHRSGIDLLLADYISSRKDKYGKALEPGFKKWAISQLRLLFFVGHDSTSATLSYSCFLLSKHPQVLEKLRAEHDNVFGKDLTALSKLLKDNPQILNKLSYTVAVIKKVLRLYPPAAGFRLGQPDVFLQDIQGNEYPTEGCRIYILHQALHRNPKYWKKPDAFIPDRFLVGPDDPLYPVRGAYRPFEHGPRNCLGQNLSMLDLRVTLAMIVRRFDFIVAYDEWDRLNGTTSPPTFQGRREYQIGDGGAHPADGMPCRVRARS